jgi:CBS domain-containing protein
METRLRSLEQLMPFATASELLARKTWPVVSIPPDAGPGYAARLMLGNDIGFLPVIEGGRLVGVLSERDLIRSVHMDGPIFVRQLMTTRVHTVSPESKIPECLMLMQREHIRHLPVVADGKVEGVLSIRDLTGSLIERHERLLRRLEGERITLLFPSGSY